MAVLDVHGVLAETIGEQGAKSFLDDTDAGKALVALCGAVALVIVVIGIFRMVTSIGRGRLSDAFKQLVFSLLIGGLLFNLNLTITGVKTMSDLTGKVFSSVTQVVGS